MPEPIAPPQQFFLETPLMLAWLVTSIALLAIAPLWWRHDRRGVAVGCLVWFGVSVAAGYAFLGSVPGGQPGSVCGNGEASPTIAFADVPVGAGCRTTARLHVAAAAGVITVGIALLAVSLWQRWRPGPVRAADAGAAAGPGPSAG